MGAIEGDKGERPSENDSKDSGKNDQREHNNMENKWQRLTCELLVFLKKTPKQKSNN